MPGFTTYLQQCVGIIVCWALMDILFEVIKNSKSLCNDFINSCITGLFMSWLHWLRKKLQYISRPLGGTRLATTQHVLQNHNLWKKNSSVFNWIEQVVDFTISDWALFMMGFWSLKHILRSEEGLKVVGEQKLQKQKYKTNPFIWPYPASAKDFHPSFFSYESPLQCWSKCPLITWGSHRCGWRGRRQLRWSWSRYCCTSHSIPAEGSGRTGHWQWACKHLK